MNRIYLCLLLPIACVVALPTHYNPEDSKNHDLPNEFWSHHFGPDFQHAIHVQLEQTDTIDTGNAIHKHQAELKDGNRKRSAYVIHKPNEQDNRTVENSMRVHLLQPAEIEALEREMMNFAKHNKMMDSPVVVNLPASEGTMAKGNDHKSPVILNIPPVVYHGNKNRVQPQFLENAKSFWSYHQKYPSYASKGQHPYEKVHSQYEKMSPSFEYKKHNLFEDKTHPLNEDQSKIVSPNLPSFENKQPSYEKNRQTSFEDKIHANIEENKKTSHEDGQEVKDDDKNKTEKKV